eukprot:m.50843 g.50843  ORF g.50843 m.50843 type:complete len:71 (-) comp48167_c0_seq2:15-227(-)
MRHFLPRPLLHRVQLVSLTEARLWQQVRPCARWLCTSTTTSSVTIPDFAGVSLSPFSLSVCLFVVAVAHQ